MTTGILCATPEEFDALHHRFEFDEEPTTLAGFQFWKGYVPDRAQPIVLAQSGIGKVNAATLATILFTTFGCDDLIFSGVAGALTDLEVGSVVLVTQGSHPRLWSGEQWRLHLCPGRRPPAAGDRPAFAGSSPRPSPG